MAFQKGIEDDLDRRKAQIVLIVGGARSGKSRHALEMGQAIEGRRLFVATAQALDDEMATRIERHKRARGEVWETREEPTEIVQVLSASQNRYSVILIDCLTLWLANLLTSCGEDHERIETYCRHLIDALKRVRTRTLVVSNEVGLGIVPENAMARSFRDLAGTLNQRVAQVADRVVFMVAGVPMVVKGSP